MIDHVVRLRAAAVLVNESSDHGLRGTGAVCLDAANEIERLRAERDDARRQRRSWHEASVADRAESYRVRRAGQLILDSANAIAGDAAGVRVPRELVGNLRAALEQSTRSIET